MERKVSFAKGEHYHLYSRGVEKRKIFLSDKDRERFISLLYILNQRGSFNLGNFLKKNNLIQVFNEKREGTLVEIISYCLMPNHFHMLVYEKQEGGISKFMAKILTAYSMYFNTKYERSGPLFVRPFRSQHISQDPHYLHIFNYIHLNPSKLAGTNEKMLSFVNSYSFSSYQEYLGKKRPQSKIINLDYAPKEILRTPLDIGDYDKYNNWNYGQV